MASSSATTPASAAAPRARRKYAARMPLEQRRTQLLDAALAVLLRDGYDGLTIDAIARRAGVTRPVVYGAFGDLATLLDTLLDRTQRRALDTVVGLLDDEAPGNAGDWIVTLITGFLTAVRREPDVWRPVLGLVPGAPQNVQRRIDETREFIRVHLARLLGDRLGGAAEVMDLDVLSHALRVTAEQFARLVLTDPQAYPPQRLIDAVRTLLGPFAQSR